MTDGIEILDLRLMRPAERHENIFQKWNNLKPGQTLKIINDHDPKPHCAINSRLNIRTCLSGNTNSRGRWTGL